MHATMILIGYCHYAIDCKPLCYGPDPDPNLYPKPDLKANPYPNTNPDFDPNIT